MDVLGQLGREPDAALVVLSFLQADHRSAEYGDELISLVRKLAPTLDLSGCTDGCLDDGCLETDGSGPSCVTLCLRGASPAEALRGPGELPGCVVLRLYGVLTLSCLLTGAAAIQQVAEELREIAAQLEPRVVAEATQNLRRNLLTSASDVRLHFHNATAVLLGFI